MKILILLILLSSTLFSQILWEIEVNPNDLLRDVTEIPNSDLLLFTYNTGKLEIRRSGDGSFVNQLIRKPNESGELRISNSGKIYHKQFYNYNHSNDSMDLRFINNNETFKKISLSVNDLENTLGYKEKKYFNIFTIENDTKLIGRIYYLFENRENDNGFFFIYNLITNEFEMKEEINLASDYSVIDKSYLSPDDKYMVEVSGIKSKARICDIQNKTFSLDFIDSNNNSKFTVLNNPSFLNNKMMSVNYAEGISLFTFPELEVFKIIETNNKFGFLVAGSYLCNDDLVINSFKKKYNGSNNEYEYWYTIFNLFSESITYNSYDNIIFPVGVKMVILKNCNQVIFINDLDYSLGKVTSYNFHTLNIENENNSNEVGHFVKIGSTINFNSREFIGQAANIDIFNSTGSKVGNLHNGILNQEIYNFQIPELPSGAYFLQCQLPNINLNFNFVVVR